MLTIPQFVRADPFYVFRISKFGTSSVNTSGKSFSIAPGMIMIILINNRLIIIIIIISNLFGIERLTSKHYIKILKLFHGLHVENYNNFFKSINLNLDNPIC